MYGLVNRAIEQLVKTQHGEDTWRRITARVAGLPGQFVSMQQYPDDVTYGLVAAASAELGAPPEQVLEGFGRYWITYTADEGYGDLLSMGGHSVQQFLLNLDALHARVGSRFDELVPPSFQCTEVKDGTLLLHYHSRRKGLAPLVVGLLKGLGERFKQPIEIEHRDRTADGASHDTFFLRIGPPAAAP